MSPEDPPKLTEEALAKTVVAWLTERDWEIHQEVRPIMLERRADIVAVKGKVLWVIEVKQSISLRLLDQAWRWRDWSSQVSIAHGRTKHRISQNNHFVHSSLHHWGIGQLVVEDDNIFEQIQPKRSKKPLLHYLEGAMNEQTKTWAAAGNAQGKFWSPFRQTCENVRLAVKKKPGMGTAEMVASIEHHYKTEASAKGSLVQWAWRGKIAGVQLKGWGKTLKWWPAKEKKK